MDPDTEVERQEHEEEEKEKWKRPPSSYGSMKSDSDDVMEEEEEEEEEENEEEIVDAFHPSLPVVEPESSTHEETGLQMIRSESPETLYTMTTQQTKPPGALVIDTRSSDLGDFSEDAEEDADEDLVADSPEPPMPVEPDDTTDENSQPGRLHPEQGLPHIFKSIQNVLAGLTREELLQFKTCFYQWQRDITLQQVMEGDLLDFVDRILEVLGQQRSLSHTISSLESINKNEEANQLRNQCKRALIRFKLREHLRREHQVIHEGVIRAGRQNFLDSVYVEPQISTCGYGGVDPHHHFRPHPPSPLQVPSADTFVGVNNLFRLQKNDGQPVRTLVTTGIAGIGMSVSGGKFSLDWAEERANKDLQFVFKLSFRTFWLLRNKEHTLAQELSIMDLIEYYHPECKDMKFLEEEDCKFLLIMDSFDCYRAALDWQNAPVINDNYTKAHTDVLIVNIIRGTVLRGARVWVLGRRAAISQIPSQYIDVFTEIQGFSDEMKDEYLTRRFDNAELAEKVVAHYKLLPSLRMLTGQPFVCWIVATVFERCFGYLGYGDHPPRLTPFYVNIMIVQTNRRLQFYYGKGEHELKWSSDDKLQLTKMGKMAFKMLERNTSVFCEEDLKEYSLDLTEVTVLSGLCTELPAAASDKKRTFCFIHFSVQEFMAAVYVFVMFRTESKNVLDTRAKLLSYIQNKSTAGLVQCAVSRTLGSPLGHYDMFLRFLCGLLSPECHEEQLGGFLFRHHMPKVGGLDEVQRLLEQAIKTAEQKNRDRVENLKECLRELTQLDE